MAAKLVLVSGASSGIGEATAKRYGADGAHVLLLARNAERLDRVAESIRRGGGSASPYLIDLSDANAIAETGARIKRESGTPDIVVNNAGAGRWLPMIETTADDALHMIEVPYLAAFNLTRAFLPDMLARGSGALAFITSPASYIAWPNASAYTAARRAIAGLAETLQAELRSSGISVTLVVLGTVESPLLAAQSRQPRASAREQSKPRADPVIRASRRGDLRRCGGRKADGGEAADLAGPVRAQRALPPPRRAPTPPRPP